MPDGAPFPRRTKRGAARKYPWDELGVGETFVLGGFKVSQFGGTLAYANASRFPKMFRSRRVETGIEIRRVK